MILQGSFYGTVRSGQKGVRIVSMRRLITTRRCMTECFAMAGERALLRFVNCWNMTGAFRRGSFRSGPRRDGGRVISRGIQGIPCCSMAGTATALRPNALRTYRASRMASRPFPRTSPMITRMPCQVGHDLYRSPPTEASRTAERWLLLRPGSYFTCRLLVRADRAERSAVGRFPSCLGIYGLRGAALARSALRALTGPGGPGPGRRRAVP